MAFREQADERKLRAQLQALNEASIAITSELGLDRVLKRIVDLARELAGARYGALGVPDGKGELEQFVVSGMTPEEAAQVGHPPRGAGLLGALLREPGPIRLADVSADPRSAGFCPGHPVMHSFLGVPITSRGKLLGTLYLTDKIDAPEFDADDENLIGMLAVHAAIAIENARLLQDTVERGRLLTQQNRELEALNAVAVAATQSLDLDALLQNTLDEVLAAMRADAGEIFLREEASGDMVLVMHRGAAPEAFYSLNRFERGVGFPGIVAATGEPLVSGELRRDTRFVREDVIRAGFKSLVCVPLAIKNEVIGVLTLARRAAGEFDARNLSLLTGFGRQIGVAVENARLYREVKRLAVVEERERIGMELHDGIIQSIYAVGLTLEYATLIVDEQPSAARQRLTQAIDGLNEVIRDIRSYILDLRPQRFEGKDLDSSLHELARSFRANTFINISLVVDPRVGTRIDPNLGVGLFHIAQEGLANVAKHARARNVSLSVRLDDSLVILELKDDGRGFDPLTVKKYTGHGMRNMEERARLLNGEWQLNSAPGQGTHIQVRVPFVPR
ncbi:MAG TPA: GAF domain-containing sensor histidine kinase [Anaerolineae bacterium]|nr:GAF domain-containing sensor histidine kinase [Anaerolineae bacterium]